MGHKRPNFHGNTTSFQKGVVPWNKGKGEFIDCKHCAKEMWVQNCEKERKKFCSKACFFKGRALKCTFQKGHAKSFLGERIHTEETRKKISVSGKGKHSREKAWNWIADRTKLKTSDQHKYNSRYRDWMKTVKNRDGWKCRINDEGCSGRLEAHHILPWATFPELRYEINNGISLCHAHHPRKRDDEQKLAPIFTKIVLATA